MRKNLFFLFILMTVLIYGECLSAQNIKTIKIALFHTFSIPDPMCYDPYGESLYNAVNMAWEDFKSANKEIDFTVRFIKYDFGGDKLKTAEIVDQAVEDGCIAGIGFTCSDYALLGGARAQLVKLPLITPTSTADKIADIGEFVYMASSNNAAQGEVLSNFVFNDLKKRQTLIIVASDCSYCLTLSDAYSEHFKQQGGKISGKIHILATDTDFSKIVNQIKHYTFDTIFLPNYAAQSAAIIAKLSTSGIETVFLGGDAWNWTGMSFAIVGNKSFTGFMVTPWTQDFPDPSSKNFVLEYNKRFGEITSIVPAHCYDSAMMLFQVIKNTRRYTRNGIKDALSRIKRYQGVTGFFQYNGNQNPKKSMAIVKLSNNTQGILKIVDPVE